MSKGEPGRGRDVAILLAAMGLGSLPFGYTLVVLPIYLNEIGFSGEIIGAITAVSSVANTIGLVPFALAADRYGRKRFVVWGFLSATLAYALFAFTHDLNLLLLASAVGGVGLAGGFSAAVWTPAWTALLAAKSHEKRASAFAWGQGIWALALTAGASMSVLPTFLRSNLRITYLASFQYTFMIFAGFAIASGLILLLVQESREESLDLRKAHPKFLPKNSLRQISRFSLTLGLVGFASGIAIQLLSLWFKKMYGVNEAVLGPWFAASEITSLIVVPIIPRMTRTLGSPKSVLATQGSSAILLAAMVLAPTYELAGIVYIVRNFLMNISWPVQQSYLMGTVASDERASASAITSTVWGVGNSIGPFLGGYFLGGGSYASISAPLLIGAAVYVTSAIAFFLLFRGRPPPEELKKTPPEAYKLL